MSLSFWRDVGVVFGRGLNTAVPGLGCHGSKVSALGQHFGDANVANIIEAHGDAGTVAGSLQTSL